MDTSLAREAFPARSEAYALGSSIDPRNVRTWKLLKIMGLVAP